MISFLADLKNGLCNGVKIKLDRLQVCGTVISPVSQLGPSSPQKCDWYMCHMSIPYLGINPNIMH